MQPPHTPPTTGPDAFDLAFGQLDGLTGALSAGPSQVQSTTPIVGHLETWTAQTIRVPDIGDTVFLQVLSAVRSFRLVVPPKVVDALRRQHEQITARARRRAARQAVQTKRDRGIPIGNAEALHRAQRTRHRRRR